MPPLLPPIRQLHSLAATQRAPFRRPPPRGQHTGDDGPRGNRACAGGKRPRHDDTLSLLGQTAQQAIGQEGRQKAQ